MVDIGTISADCEELSSLLTNYNASTSNALSNWLGDSSNNFEAITNDFYSEAQSIKNQFDPFKNAISAYNDLQVAKANYKTYSNYYYYYSNLEDETDHSATISWYYSLMKTEEDKINKLKEQINSNLEAVGGLIVEGGTGVTEVFSTSAVVQAAIDWALATAADDSIGYSQETRWGNPNYDCSSFVITAYENAGTGVKEAGAITTFNMRSVFIEEGFIWIPWSEIGSTDNLQAGDVLLNEDQHTEMYIGDNQVVGAHGRDGKRQEDQVSVTNYWYGNWDGVLRYVGTDNQEGSDTNDKD